MYTAQQVIKDKFWIVNSNYGKVGTLRRIDQGYEFFDQNTGDKTVLNSPDEIITFDVDRPSNEVAGEVTVEGLPTGCNTAIADSLDGMITFRKSENSKTHYGAGYWLIKFTGSAGWQWALAPKVATLTKYISKGPYRTEWEATLMMGKFKRQGQDEDFEINRNTSTTD